MHGSGARPARRGESKFGCEPTAQFPVFERRRVPSLAVMSNAVTVPIAPVARPFTADRAIPRIRRSPAHSRLRRSGKNYKRHGGLFLLFHRKRFCGLGGFPLDRLTARNVRWSEEATAALHIVLARRPLPPVRGCPSPTDPL